MSKLANLERNFCRNVKPVRHGAFSDSPDNELMRHFAWFSTKKSVAIIERSHNHRIRCAKIDSEQRMDRSRLTNLKKQVLVVSLKT